MITDMNLLQRQLHEWTKGMDWWDGKATIGDKLRHMVTEVLEAMEENERFPNSLDNVYHKEGGKPEGFLTELADVVMIALDISEHIGVPLSRVIHQKLAHNKTRVWPQGADHWR